MEITPVPRPLSSLDGNVLTHQGISTYDKLVRFNIAKYKVQGNKETDKLRNSLFQLNDEIYADGVFTITK